MRYLFVGWLLLGTLWSPPAEAHLANFGSWEITREYLGVLFPEATEFKAKRYSFDALQVENIEAELGFELYPEDHNPTFYVAQRVVDGKAQFLGVGIFIDPRLEPKALGGAALKLECGIGVGPDGGIKKVAVFDYKGDLELTRAPFLDQFRGKKLESKFKVGEGVEPVPGEEESSQLVANAAYEALYLMKVALGKGARTSSESPEKEGPSCATADSQPGLELLLWLSMLAGCAGGIRRASGVRRESRARSES